MKGWPLGVGGAFIAVILTVTAIVLTANFAAFSPVPQPHWHGAGQQLMEVGSRDAMKEFELLDLDGSGSLELQEMQAAAGPAAEAKRALHELDTNGDGRLQFDEYLVASEDTQQADDELTQADAQQGGDTSTAKQG